MYSNVKVQLRYERISGCGYEVALWTIGDADYTKRRLHKKITPTNVAVIELFCAIFYLLTAPSLFNNFRFSLL